MKRIISLVLALCLLLCGCSWMDGEYHSVTPHAYEGKLQPQDITTVTGYNELRDALVGMASEGVTEGTFYIVDVAPEQIDQYMNTAIMHVFQSSAIGAYAVEEITYEAGTFAEHDAIAVDITYLHGRQEILRIKKARDMEALKAVIGNALNSCEPSVVVKVDDYNTLDVIQFVQDYVDSNPQNCMEMPQVAAMVYPQTGKERVVEVTFTYQTSREALRAMQDNVSPIFSAAKLYVQGSEDEQQKYSQLYSFLMERFDYQLETSITPAYSLLRYGVGDSKAFASVYSVMCQNADLTCKVVTGTRNGDAWYWNHVKIGESFYHVDLLAEGGAGEFAPRLSEEMAGYVWDYSEYP